MAKIVSIPLAIILSILSIFIPSKVESPDKTQWETNYPYVFVHGLMGQGDYDPHYKIMPYWGMFGGELLGKLDKKGYSCYAASVSGTASAWDRACELYAQLTGTVRLTASAAVTTDTERILQARRSLKNGIRKIK